LLSLIRLRREYTIPSLVAIVDGNLDVTVTVTSDGYCAMLENFLQSKLDDLFTEHGAENVFSIRDGATAHTSRRSLGILREMFPGHVVSLC
jgi:hypothetical protein